MTSVILDTMEARQSGALVDAEKAYHDLLKRIHENALDNFESLGQYASEIKDANIFSEAEMATITESMFMENIVWNCFSTSKASSPLLSSITLRILLQRMLDDKQEKIDIGVKKCVVVFETGGKAVHYVVRVVFKRLLPSRSAYLHLDIGSRAYDQCGLNPTSVVYGGEPDEELVWFDEVDKKAMKEKRRNEIMYVLWNKVKDPTKFLRLVSKGLTAEERIAVHLAVGRLVPKWDEALGYINL